MAAPRKKRARRSSRRSAPAAAPATPPVSVPAVPSPETVAAAQRRIDQAKFIDAFRGTGNVSAAAAIAGVGRRTHYDWIRDEEYAALFADAVDEAADRLETEARRRAMQGTRKPVFHKGQVCGHIIEYSDTLLIFLLKGARPERYAERHVVGGKGKNGAIAFTLEDLVSPPDPETPKGEA